MHPKLAALHRYLETLNNPAGLSEVSDLLTSLTITADDLFGDCEFSETTPKVNRLASSEWYELLLMCSRSGQATTIHDHGGSSCAFKILKGVASETFFKRVPGARGYQGYVTPTGASKLYKYGQVCSIPDGEIYRIANNQTGQDLITLHLYSPPSQMSLFEVYNPQKGPPVDQIKSARLVNLSI